MLMLAMVAGSVNAQTRYCARNSGKDIRHDIPIPHKNIRPPHWTKPCNVSYDAASTVLTVKFPTNGGSVTVSHNGAQVASMTAGSGTTFHSELRQYGTGNYTVIVSNCNTVVETKNFTVR